MTLREILKNNPYGNYIIPVIEGLSTPVGRASSPFEALIIGYLLKYRSLTWNEGAFDLSAVSRAGVEKCCDCATNNGSDCCGPCPSQLITSAYESIVQSARSVNVGNPYTPLVKAFEAQLSGMSMNQPNAWVYFQQIIDVFYANVSFLSYFTINYFNGLYPYHFTSTVGGDYRDGFNYSGLSIKTISEGANPATKATSDLVVDTVLNPGDDNTYFTIFTNAASRFIYWFDISGGGVQPVVAPIVDVTDTYQEITLDSANPAEDIANSIATQILGGVAYDLGSVTVIGTTVRMVVKNNGSLPTSDFTNLPAHDAWNGTFTDYIPGTPNQEVTEIKFDKVVNDQISGRYFILYNGNESHLFWYNVENRNVQPIVVADFYHEIVIPTQRSSGGIWCCPANELPPNCTKSTSPCGPSFEEVQSITNGVIVSTGLFTASVVSTLTTHVTTIATADTINSDGGTSAIGAANVVTNLVAPDGTNFGGSYVTDMAYAKAWNSIVVPYMANKNQPTHYLKPAYDTSLGGFMLHTTFPSITEDLKFNIPGNTQARDKEERCRTCLM